MHELLIQHRLYADHGQFYVFDESVDPYTPVPEITDETVRRGWTRSNHAIYYFTVGELWDFRLDVYRSASAPALEEGSRLLVNNLDLPSGNVRIGNPVDEELASISVTPGTYAFYLRASNLGKEADDELDDDDILKRTDLEMYELFLVENPAASEGVIAGAETLW